MSDELIDGVDIVQEMNNPETDKVVLIEFLLSQVHDLRAKLDCANVEITKGVVQIKEHEDNATHAVCQLAVANHTHEQFVASVNEVIIKLQNDVAREHRHVMKTLSTLRGVFLSHLNDEEAALENPQALVTAQSEQLLEFSKAPASPATMSKADGKKRTTKPSRDEPTTKVKKTLFTERCGVLIEHPDSDSEMDM